MNQDKNRNQGQTNRPPQQPNKPQRQPGQPEEIEEEEGGHRRDDEGEATPMRDPSKQKPGSP